MDNDGKFGDEDRFDIEKDKDGKEHLIRKTGVFSKEDLGELHAERDGTKRTDHMFRDNYVVRDNNVDKIFAPDYKRDVTITSSSGQSGRFIEKDHPFSYTDGSMENAESRDSSFWGGKKSSSKRGSGHGVDQIQGEGGHDGDSDGNSSSGGEKGSQSRKLSGGMGVVILIFVGVFAVEILMWIANAMAPSGNPSDPPSKSPSPTENGQPRDSRETLKNSPSSRRNTGGQNVEARELSASEAPETMVRYKPSDTGYHPSAGVFELTAGHPTTTVYVSGGSTMKFDADHEFWLKGPASHVGNDAVIRKMPNGISSMKFYGSGVLILQGSNTSGLTRVRINPSGTVGIGFGKYCGMPNPGSGQQQSKQIIHKSLTQQAKEILQLGKH